MPTKPIATITGELTDENLIKLLSDFSLHIEEVVAFGSHILNWIGNSGKLLGDYDIPLTLGFRNALELIDSISILIKQSSIDPAKLQLRALLETLFVIRYITEKDSEIRGYNFMTCHFHEKITLYKQTDPTTQEGKQYLSEIKKDIFVSKMKTPTISDLNNRILNIENIFRNPKYLASEQEYRNIKKHKKPVWYEFFGGPKNIQKLAEHLKMNAMYNILYRSYSRNVHGMDIIDTKISKGQPGYMEILQIRAPHEVQPTCLLTISLSLDLYTTIIKHYIPGKIKDYGHWYKTEIRDFFLKISGEKLLIVN